MPNGLSSPSANTPALAELRKSGAGCNTETRPPRVSVTNRSPPGATRILRGPCRSLANIPTLKPFGTDSSALAGRGTNLGLLRAEGVANGAGSAFKSILWTRPGASFFQSLSEVAPAAAGAVAAAFGAGAGG